MKPSLFENINQPEWLVIQDKAETLLKDLSFITITAVHRHAIWFMAEPQLGCFDAAFLWLHVNVYSWMIGIK